MAKTGHSGGVSETGMVVYIDDTNCAQHLMHDVVFFVVNRGAAQMGNSLGTVHPYTVFIIFLKGFITCLFYPLGDFRQGPVPILFSQVLLPGAR